ncbi:hypothetical protein [Streptomyces sp. BRA346]|uniref:hypothetical protein n=1 Tax=Streptomyces sp. BRA346 TaxID=2878199 RepID=UPI004062E584
MKRLRAPRPGGDDPIVVPAAGADRQRPVTAAMYIRNRLAGPAVRTGRRHAATLPGGVRGP